MGILCPHWQNSLYSKKHRINLSNRICHLAIDLHCIFKVNVVPICAGVYHHGLYFQSILSACFNLLVVLRKITEFFFMMENSPQQTEAQFEFWLMGPGLYSCIVDIIITVSMQLYKMQSSSLHIINKII